MMADQTATARCSHAELVAAYAVHALPPTEAAHLETHLETCADCRQDLESLGRVTATFADWPIDISRPPVALWHRLQQRIAGNRVATESAAPELTKTGWREVAGGVLCRFLAVDAERDRVSMLIRMAPGAGYPPHRHAESEQIYVLHGELIVDDRRYRAGDYECAEPGTTDAAVWTERGCTCIVITSSRDQLLIH